MKKLLSCFIFFTCLMLPCISQDLHKTDTGKYRINLPDYWGRGNKVWQVLTDKLPLICEELKDKELCGDDCNAKYIVEFEMTDPYISEFYPRLIFSDNTPAPNRQASDTWDIDTYYSFECSLLLFDNNDKLLTRLVLVDTNEVYKVTHRTALASFTSSSPARYAFRKGATRSETIFMDLNTLNNVNGQPTSPSGQNGQTAFSYINENKEKLYPTRKDLLAVVDAKLKAL